MCLRSVVVVCRRVAATFSTHSSTRFKRNTQRVSVKTNALHFALANEPLSQRVFDAFCGASTTHRWNALANGQRSNAFSTHLVVRR